LGQPLGSHRQCFHGFEQYPMSSRWPSVPGATRDGAC
jgi:hypothetical protein